MAEKIVKDLWTGEHIVYENDNGTTYVNSKASVFKKAKGSSEVKSSQEDNTLPTVSSLDLEPKPNPNLATVLASRPRFKRYSLRVVPSTYSITM